MENNFLQLHEHITGLKAPAVCLLLMFSITPSQFKQKKELTKKTFIQ